MKLLVVELGSPLKISTLDESEVEPCAKSQGFDEPDPDQSNGFYDYMRTDPGTIVGVRWSPFPQAEFVLDRVTDSKLLRIRSDGMLRSLQVWFKEPTDVDESLSDDRLFWYNRVFVNALHGRAIVTFALPERGEPKTFPNRIASAVPIRDVNKRRSAAGFSLLGLRAANTRARWPFERFHRLA